MKGIFCCLQGESSNQSTQEPPQQHPPQEPPQQHPPQEPPQQHPPQEPPQQHPPQEPPQQHPPQEPSEHSLPGTNPESSPLLDRIFQWKELVNGTRNFKQTNFIGQGNFGEVYRCDFPEYNAVGAAKIQKTDNPNTRREFIAETTMLQRANHPNVIRLFGKCFDREHGVAMVYEFMLNGPLDRHLFAQSSRLGPGLLQEVPGLNWETRMKIAVGVAKALVYLHKKQKVIHRDIKVSNVLLDENFEPKLTGFGFANRFYYVNGVERERVFTPIQETQGSVAPETEHFGLVSTKSDVFSYGVLLFQLMTGRKAYDIERPPKTRKFTDWLIPVCGRVQNMSMVVDVALGNRYPEEGLVSLFLVASMCIDPQVSARPDMGFVEDMVRLAAAHKVPERPTVTKRVSI